MKITPVRIILAVVVFLILTFLIIEGEREVPGRLLLITQNLWVDATLEAGLVTFIATLFASGFAPENQGPDESTTHRPFG